MANRLAVQERPVESDEDGGKDGAWGVQKCPPLLGLPAGCGHGWVLPQLLAPAPTAGPVAVPLQPLRHPTAPSRASRDRAQRGSR